MFKRSPGGSVTPMDELLSTMPPLKELTISERQAPKPPEPALTSQMQGFVVRGMAILTFLVPLQFTGNLLQPQSTQRFPCA